MKSSPHTGIGESHSLSFAAVGSLRGRHPPRKSRCCTSKPQRSCCNQELAITPAPRLMAAQGGGGLCLDCVFFVGGAPVLNSLFPPLPYSAPLQTARQFIPMSRTRPCVVLRHGFGTQATCGLPLAPASHRPQSRPFSPAWHWLVPHIPPMAMIENTTPRSFLLKLNSYQIMPGVVGMNIGATVAYAYPPVTPINRPLVVMDSRCRAFAPGRNRANRRVWHFYVCLGSRC